jgi:hypothetical protein
MLLKQLIRNLEEAELPPQSYWLLQSVHICEGPAEEAPPKPPSKLLFTYRRIQMPQGITVELVRRRVSKSVMQSTTAENHSNFWHIFTAQLSILHEAFNRFLINLAGSMQEERPTIMGVPSTNLNSLHA